jgi:hypothetical protein
MRLTIDRFEESWVVLEDESGDSFPLPRRLLPAESQVGDILQVRVLHGLNRSLVILTRDPGATERQRTQAEALLARLRAKKADPGGDLKL